MENLFMPINDLIFLPINAIKEADITLSNGILKQIATFSDTQKEHSDTPIMKLKNIKFLYEKKKSDEAGDRIETMGLTVPTASIIPLSALQINGSVIKFNIEVKSEYDENQSIILSGKAAPKTFRPSDFLPKMHFKIKTECATIPEGIARLIDILDMNQIPSIEDKQYVNSNGIAYKNQDIYSAKNNLLNELDYLNIIIEKLNNSITSLDKKLKAKMKEISQEDSKTNEYHPEVYKLSMNISELRESLKKYIRLRDDKEYKLLDTEMSILEDNMHDTE